MTSKENVLTSNKFYCQGISNINNTHEYLLPRIKLYIIQTNPLVNILLYLFSVLHMYIDISIRKNNYTKAKFINIFTRIKRQTGD